MIAGVVLKIAHNFTPLMRLRKEPIAEPSAPIGRLVGKAAAGMPGRSLIPGLPEREKGPDLNPAP